MSGASGRAARRAVRWIVLPVAGLAVVGLVGSNLILRTRVGRGWIEGGLERRTGMDWEVGRASWTPWSGVELGGLRGRIRGVDDVRVRPVYEVGTLRLAPYWGRLIRGDLVMREVRVEGFRAALPVELLAAGSAPAADAAPDGAGQRGSEAKTPGGAGEGGTAKPGGKKGGSGTRKPAGGKGKKAAAPDGAEGGGKSPPARVVPRLPARVIIADAGIELYSLVEPGRTLTLAGISGELPVAGEAAGGWVRAAAVRWGGAEVLGPVEAKLEWAPPHLRLPKTEFRWFGMVVRVDGSVRIGGLPIFAISGEIPAGPLEPLSPGDDLAVEVSARAVQGRGRLGGNLALPHTWRGDLAAGARGVVIRQADRGAALSFDRASVAAVMQGGNVRIADVRLVGEQLSFLGNGLVLSDGRVAGILRVVAAPDVAEVVTQVAMGSLLSQGWTRAWLAPLETPDRYYRDLHLAGTVQGAVIDVGRKHEALPVGLAWQRIWSFIKSEIDEERRERAHPPQSEPPPPES